MRFSRDRNPAYRQRLARSPRHLSQEELLAHAEAEMDRQPVSARCAAHLAVCPACAKEAETLGRSLRMVGASHGMEPSRELTARILMAAQQERNTPPAGRSGWAMAGRWAAGLACAVLALCAAPVFRGVLSAGNTAEAATASANPAPPEKVITRETLRQTIRDVEGLSTAVRRTAQALGSPRQATYQQAARALEQDIAAARAALDRNPGSVRVLERIHTNLERQAKTLRNLYINEEI